MSAVTQAATVPECSTGTKCRRPQGKAGGGVAARGCGKSRARNIGQHATGDTVRRSSHVVRQTRDLIVPDSRRCSTRSPRVASRGADSSQAGSVLRRRDRCATGQCIELKSAVEQLIGLSQIAPTLL